MTQVSLDQAIQLGLGHHQAGRFDEARRIYQQILAAFPKNAAVLHLLGVLNGQVGQFDAAIKQIGAAIAIDLTNDVYYLNYGNALDKTGRRDEAIKAYEHALGINPNSAEAHFNLGVAYNESGRTERAIAEYSRAIELNPSLAEAHNALGEVWEIEGKLAEAAAAYEKAVRLKPAFVAAWINLGNALSDNRQYPPAIAAYQKAIDIDPTIVEAHNNMGFALRDIGAFDQAIASMEKASALKPDAPGIYISLGHILKDSGKFDRAKEAWQNAIRLDPNSAEAYSCLSTALAELGRLDEAETAVETALKINPALAQAHSDKALLLLARGHFKEALAEFQTGANLKPDDAQINFNMAAVRLLLGDFERGLREYEWRWKVKGMKLNFRQWQGEPLEGKTIVLHAEQGIGDTIQFIRYAPLLAERGAKVILSCQPTLMRLMKSMKGIDKIVSIDEPIPPCDARCALLSLPLAFGTRLETIPGSRKYLDVDERLTRSWADKLGPTTQTRIGLVWAGSPGFRTDHRRSIPLQQFAPLASIGNVEFHSLQKGPAAWQPSPFPNLMRPTDLNDFADTAALIANLDLVISVDTSVAHVAAALGKPVWLLLPFVPDWRWMLDRTDTPWYLTMRLFRQKNPGDWTPVIQSVATELTAIGRSGLQT